MQLQTPALSLNLKRKEVEEEIKHHKVRDYGVPWLTATEYCWK